MTLTLLRSGHFGLVGPKRKAMDPNEPKAPARKGRTKEQFVKDELARLRPSHYSIAYKALENREDSEDAVQAAHLRIWRRADLYDESRSFTAWAYRILQNVVISAGRRRSHILRHCLPDAIGTMLNAEGEPLEVAIADEGADPLHILLGAMPDDLQAALEKLPHLSRACVVCFYLNGLTQDETAEVLGIPTGTVRSRLHRARIKLREIFEKGERC